MVVGAAHPIVVVVTHEVAVTAATGVYRHQSDGAPVNSASMEETSDAGSSLNQDGYVVAVYDGQTVVVATVVTPGYHQPVTVAVVVGATGVYLHQSDGAPVNLASIAETTEAGSSLNHAGYVVAVYGGQTVVVATVVTPGYHQPE